MADRLQAQGSRDSACIYLGSIIVLSHFGVLVLGSRSRATQLAGLRAAASGPEQRLAHAVEEFVDRPALFEQRLVAQQHEVAAGFERPDRGLGVAQFAARELARPLSC